MIRRSSRLHPRLRALGMAVACTIAGPACATYHVYQVGGRLESGNQPSTEWEGKTLHALVWGAVRQDLPVENCALGDGTRIGIEEVRVRSNVGTTLATVLTLGFWQPLKVSWRCARPPAEEGTLEPDQ